MIDYLNTNFIALCAVFTAYFMLNNLAIFSMVSKMNLSIEFRYLFTGISPFIVVLYAYIFKIIGLLDFFPLIYLGTLLLLILVLKKNVYKIITNLKIDYILIFLFLFYIYFFTYDSINHLTEGGVDVLRSFGFIQSILSGNETAYQPGIALWLNPIYPLLLIFQDLGLIGAWIGIIIIFQAYLLLLFFSKWISRYFLTFLVVPIFFQLNILFIGFTSTSWGLISILAFLIYLINVRKYSSQRKVTIIFGLMTFAGTALIVPTILPYYIPILGILFLIDLALKDKNAVRNILTPFLGVLGSLGVYGLNLFLSNKNYRSEISNLYVTELPDNTSSVTVNLILDFLSIKGSIRPITDIFDFFGWIIFITFVLSLIFSIRFKNQHRIVMSLCGAFFGFVTMFGIFEISFFKGRAGIYFLIIFLLSMAIIASYVHKKYLGKWLFIFSAGLALSSAYLFPVVQYRYHDEKIYYKTLELLKDHKITNDAIVYTTLPQLNFVSIDFDVRNMDRLFEINPFSKQQVIVLLDFNMDFIDPVLSRQFEYQEVHNSDINATLTRIRDEKIKKSEEIETRIIKHNFTLIFEDENYKIYSN